MDFSEEPLQARIMCDGIVKVLKENNCQLRILCLAKLCLKNEGEIKTLPKKVARVQYLPYKNPKKSPSRWNEKLLNSNIKHTKVCLADKYKYIGKCRICNSVTVVYKSLLILVWKWNGKSIKSN